MFIFICISHIMWYSNKIFYFLSKKTFSNLRFQCDQFSLVLFREQFILNGKLIKTETLLNYFSILQNIFFIILILFFAKIFIMANIFNLFGEISEFHKGKNKNI